MCRSKAAAVKVPNESSSNSEALLTSSVGWARELVEQGFGRRIGEVGLDDQAGDFAGERLGLGAGAVAVHGDAPAVRGERAGECRANAAGAASDSAMGGLALGEFWAERARPPA
jgi:hypothetical protein